METMVKEGVTYARTMHGASEAPLRIDPDALFDSLVLDYVDAGKDVSLHGRIDTALVTRPQALRRIVGNLVDNALKFGGSAEIRLAASPGRAGDESLCSIAGQGFRLSRWKRCLSRSTGWKDRVIAARAARGSGLRLHGNSPWRWMQCCRCITVPTVAWKPGSC